MIGGLRQRPLVEAALGGVLLAALVLLFASLVARPTGYGRRLAALQEGASILQGQATEIGSINEASLTLCTTAPTQAQAGLNERLREASATAGVRLTSVEPEAAPVGQIAFSIRSSGPYAATLQFLDGLDNGAPTIFVRALDLTHTDAGVDLDLKGAILCSP